MSSLEITHLVRDDIIGYAYPEFVSYFFPKVTFNICMIQQFENMMLIILKTPSSTSKKDFFHVRDEFLLSVSTRRINIL